ncbi:MAG: pyridoxamine 5'-phosphate oxidase family protein [Candidatus Hodarchaeota archaeon]
MVKESIFSEAEKNFLVNLRVARIATIDPEDNLPHLVPICFSFVDNSFFTSLSKTSKRLKNIDKNNKASILFDEYEEKSGKWTILQGILIKIDIKILNYKEHTKGFMKGWIKLIEKYPQYKTWAHEDLSPTDPDLRRIMQMKPIKKIIWGFF